MTTCLSVNLNKIALLRNARTGQIPSLADTARRVLDAGAAGITVHPRPDMRHIRPSDVHMLAELLDKHYPDKEFNIEGNPCAPAHADGYPGFMPLVLAVRPTQATLVPDTQDQLTSDHGWALPAQSNDIESAVLQLKAQGTRVSLFMDAGNLGAVKEAARMEIDRIEVYTGPFAEAFERRKDDPQSLTTQVRAYSEIARAAERAAIGVNAGHDLNLHNLGTLLAAHQPLEVSIGHAFTAEALVYGLRETVRRYTAILDQSEEQSAAQ